jgi:ParB family transcriptional regulator, chromosome partitioning protein
VNRRGGLGRGLAALIPPGEQPNASLVEVAVEAVVPNARQPREVFDEEELEGLATSIRDMGLLQPIVVRALGEDRYELVAGERRLRAARLAGLETLPALVRHTEDADLLKEALVENIHRVQLNPLEEAAAYRQLLDDFGFTQEELAGRLGKSRPAVSNALRLLALPPGVQRRVAAGILSAGHAKALLAVSGEREQERLAERIVAAGLSVRGTEELVRLRLLDGEDAAEEAPRGSRRSSRVTAPGLVELQDDLSDALMTRVKISMGSRKGRLQVEFSSVDDLERIVGVIAKGLESGLPGRTTEVATVAGGMDDAASVPDGGAGEGAAAETGPLPQGPGAWEDPPVGDDGAAGDEAGSSAEDDGEAAVLEMADDETAVPEMAEDVDDLDLDRLEELTRPDG